MGKYVDGFLIPIPVDKIEEYREISQTACDLWMEHGALSYFECQADDLAHENMVSFSQSANAAEDETVIFSWIVFASKEQRDAVNAAVMGDERMQAMMKNSKCPFDYKRMVYGGFKAIVEG